MNMKRFADFWRGTFFFLASISLIVALYMFIVVWQPIWTAGFKDFHTISKAIAKLDETAKPAAAVAPSMLQQMTEMNASMKQMDINITAMRDSVATMEQLNPNILRVNYTMEQMTYIMSNQMGRMNYEVDQMGDKFSPFGMMPFNW